MSRPSYPIIDAILAPALAMDARTIKVLGVVLSLLNNEKESRVSVIATIERPAPVRSMVMRTSICRGLSSDPLVSLGRGCIVYYSDNVGSWITSVMKMRVHMLSYLDDGGVKIRHGNDERKLDSRL